MSEREEPFGEGELRNNNRQGGVPADGDANANEIQPEGGGTTGNTGSLLGPASETTEQDKVIIWGTDSQCDDPELAEFEMLECQELEAYLVEDGEDFVGLAERKALQEHQPSGRKATLEETTDNKSREDGKAIVREASEQESTVSHASEGREASRNELSSETDVFVTCLSTFSSMVTAVDTVGRTQMTDSWQPESEDVTLASQTISERVKAEQPALSAAKSTNQHKGVDMNSNSTAFSESFAPQAQVTNRVLSERAGENNNQEHKAGNTLSGGGCERGRSAEHKILPKVNEESSVKMDKSTQADEMLPKTGTKGTQSSIEPKAIKNQGSFDNALKKQHSFDRSYKKQPSFEYSFKKQLSFDNSLKKPGPPDHAGVPGSSSLERRKPWGSPSRPASPASPKTTSCSPKRRPPASPAKVPGARTLSSERSESPQRGAANTAAPPPRKTSLSSGIPKPVLPQQKEAEPRRSSPPQKPKNVRPKIITYVRKNPQAKPQAPDAPHEAPSRPPRLSSYPSPPAHRDPKAVAPSKSAPVLCSSNLLFDKYRQEMQKAGYYPPGGAKPLSGPAPPRLGGKSGSFHEEEKYLQEAPQEGGSVYRSPRTLRPQLGLGAVTRQPAAKARAQPTAHRATPGPHPSRGSAPGQHELAGEQRRPGPETTPRSLLLKSGQSGLRPPGFSALPPARLAAFGFVRTPSASSVSSNQSNDSGHSDTCQHAHHASSGSDDAPLLTSAPGDGTHAQMRPHPPNAPSLHRRSLPPQHSSPIVSRKELQRDVEAAMSPKSSPKRFAVVSPKPQSPVRGRTAAVQGAVRTDRAQELDRALIQQLRERCERQDLQLQTLQAQLKKASLCLDVFSITTQHFCRKSESAAVKERELSLELARIRDEVAFSVAHWEQLQQEKEELERRFEAELQGLRARQQRELGALEERLKARHAEETAGLKAEQRAELDELRFKQQEQLEEMSESHEASLMEMETAHNDTLATLQEEHARTVKNLKMAHEQQRRSLEEEFEKIRLSLQDQVDTLTFQNRSLRDRAKRFEEALRRSTDEQIVDALAPYKHIEEDLKSLKEVLEMKNQQIHQQELKISELEKIAEKNVYLEEKLQVLQQQNEDLKERIDKNLAVSRQLSEENANLQVNVEKESNEKKRLSRTNEELLWRLQTGELSPRMSPSSSPIHRPPSAQGSPARPHSYHQ